MTDDTIASPISECNEDYTGSVCWAFWSRKSGIYDTRQALIDVEDFERLKHLRWSIQKIGKSRKLRVVRDSRVYLARELRGFPEGKTVDHENLDLLDDRLKNLRVCTVGENNLNRRQSPLRRSQFKGVAWLPTMNCWQVYTGKRGARVLVGRFDDEIEAARAYNEYAKIHYGAYAYLNPV
jgi:hypothetical protein